MARHQFTTYLSRLDPIIDGSGRVGRRKREGVTDVAKLRDNIPISQEKELALKASAGLAVPDAGTVEPRPFELPKLPQISRKEGGRWATYLFLGTFLLPLLISVYYYTFVASDIYKSEFRFSVRNVNSSQGASPVNSVMSLAGISSGSDTVNYQVADFLISRAAIDQLMTKFNVIDLYSGSSVDWFSRFNSRRPLEIFETYWQNMVVARYDQVTGIVSVTVKAFAAQDAYLIANTLIASAEDLVNNLEQRTLNDAVKNAMVELKKTQDRLEEAHIKLTQFRRTSGVIDPSASLVASNSALVQALESSLATLQARYDTLISQKLDPKGVVLVSLANEIAAAREQLRTVEKSVATTRGQSKLEGAKPEGDALSKIIAEYEKINLEYQFAQALVTNAQSTLAQAKVNALSQHLYITPYVRPSLPTSPQLPRRVFSILLAAGICFVIWFVSYVMIKDVRERFGNAGA